MVLDKSIHGKERQYTKHCNNHGGHQELDAYRRAEARKLTELSTQNTQAEILNSLGASELVPSDRTASSTLPPSLPWEQNPKARGGLVPQDTTSIERPISSIERPISGVGGTLEKVTSRNLSSPSAETGGHEETMYTVPDRTLRASFEKKLKGPKTLDEELALIRTMIQEIWKRMHSGTNAAEELRQLTKLLPLADKMLNTIHRIESTRSVQYTRESLRMDVMRAASALRRVVPDGPLQMTGQELRRNMAIELTKVLGPTLASTGDIVITRETFKRG